MRSGSSSARKYNYSAQQRQFYNLGHGSSSNFQASRQFEAAGYPDEIFSFDDEVFRGRRRAQQFPPFEKDPPCDLIAASLMEQNSHLKERLRCSEQVISQLESELSHYRKQLFHLKEQLQKERICFQRKAEEFRSQIVAIISSNKELEAELRALKNIVTQRHMGKSGERGKPSTKSLDKFCLKENRNILNINSIQTSNSMEGRKVEELLDSIRSMHFKIMGARADSLKDLWRWLKGIAQAYSCLRRWREKFADLNVHSRNEKFREAVSEVFQILD